MKLEKATTKDLEQLLLLQKKAFQDQALIYNDFSLPPLTQTIDEIETEFGKKEIFKLERDGRIIASVRCFIENDTLYIEKLFVDPDFQNRGIGISVLCKIEERYAYKVNRYALFTGDKSKRNLHIYKKLAYQEVRREATNHGYELIYLEKINDKKPCTGSSGT